MRLPLQTCLYSATAAAVVQSRLHEPCSVHYFVSCSFVPLAPNRGDATGKIQEKPISETAWCCEKCHGIHSMTSFRIYLGYVQQSLITARRYPTALYMLWPCVHGGTPLRCSLLTLLNLSFDSIIITRRPAYARVR